MAPRSRTLVMTRAKGTARNNSGTINIGGGTLNCYVSTCDDQTGPGDNAPFSVERWSFEGGLMHKQNLGGGGFFNYIPDALNVPGNWGHGSVSGLSLDSVYAISAAARSNPSRPYVDIPVAVAELGDLVHLIRETGRGLFSRTAYRRLGNANLGFNFGFLPLVNDIGRILNFQKQLDRRLDEIEVLRGPKGYRRTFSVDRASTTTTINKSMQSNLATYSNVCTRKTSTEVRAHVRWFADPNHPLPPRGSREMRALAQRAVLGLTLDRSTLWEALPWTWLIDWGTNIGNYFKSQRNIIPCLPPHVHIMRHTLTHYTWPSKEFGSSPPGIADAGEFIRESKGRSASVLTPTAHFPLLSGKQVGIVASLAVTRL